MALVTNAAGTSAASFQIGGTSGPSVVADSGNIDAKNAAGTAYVNVRGADPVGNNDFVTLEYANTNFVASKPFVASWFA